MTDARVNLQPGFVLHTTPYRESSVVVEVFTRDHGRVALVARGARRPASALRGLIQPFTPLLLSWFGKAELKTLHAAEWQGGLAPPQGRALMCGFYLNELLLRLLARGDAHDTLYTDYLNALMQLAGSAAFAHASEFEQVLRRFEKRLLAETGYGASFDVDAGSGAAIDPDARYVYQPEDGARRAAGQDGIAVRGQTLLDLAADRFDSARTLAESKVLMRALINHVLGGKPLYTRQLLRDLTDLSP
jgi:DNA repair protein RecO (recombination protein O)